MPQSSPACKGGNEQNTKLQSQIKDLHNLPVNGYFHKVLSNFSPILFFVGTFISESTHFHTLLPKKKENKVLNQDCMDYQTL